jgi:hypothetical protein
MEHDSGVLPPGILLTPVVGECLDEDHDDNMVRGGR